MADDRPDPEPDEEDVERGSRIAGGRTGRSSRGGGRSSQTEQTSQPEEMAEPPQTEEMSQSTDSAETDESSQTEQTSPSEVPLKDRRHDTYYLLEDLAEQVDLRLDETNLKLRQEHGAEAKLEKNRHWRPLLLALGLDRVEEMDVDEIREYLDDHDLLDDASQE